MWKSRLSWRQTCSVYRNVLALGEDASFLPSFTERSQRQTAVSPKSSFFPFRNISHNRWVAILFLSFLILAWGLRESSSLSYVIHEMNHFPLVSPILNVKSHHSIPPHEKVEDNVNESDFLRLPVHFQWLQSIVLVNIRYISKLLGVDWVFSGIWSIFRYTSGILPVNHPMLWLSIDRSCRDE